MNNATNGKAANGSNPFMEVTCFALNMMCTYNVLMADGHEVFHIDAYSSEMAMRAAERQTALIHGVNVDAVSASLAPDRCYDVFCTGEHMGYVWAENETDAVKGVMGLINDDDSENYTAIEIASHNLPERYTTKA